LSVAKLCFGVIGWGYWGPKIARNLNAIPHSSVTKIADIDRSRLIPLTLNRPLVQTTTQVEELFRSDIDGVVIATPVSTHYSLARDALLHAKHVLVEKPLTASIAEAEELIELAKARELILMVGHTFVYNPAVNKLRELIQNNDLGRIYCIEAERVHLGLFRSDINVIWDLASHDISILLYLLGRQPERIMARGHAHLRPCIQDIAHLDLEFPQSLSAHIHVSWMHPCKIRRITVIGDTKMAVYDDTNQVGRLKIYNKGADILADPVLYSHDEPTIPHFDWIEPLQIECEDFVHAIRTGTPPRADGIFGLDVVRILSTAEESLGMSEAFEVKVLKNT
jgi:predicted dehydrogenase